jgi:hypothetical protein
MHDTVKGPDLRVGQGLSSYRLHIRVSITPHRATKGAAPLPVPRPPFSLEPCVRDRVIFWSVGMFVSVFALTLILA